MKLPINVSRCSMIHVALKDCQGLNKYYVHCAESDRRKIQRLERELLAATQSIKDMIAAITEKDNLLNVNAKTFSLILSGSHPTIKPIK